MGNYFQKILTKKLSPVINMLGIDLLTKPFYSGKGQILKLHRVIPWSGKERIHNHLSLEISPDHLEDIITFFRKKDYDFISLDMLPVWLHNNQRTKKKFVIFTLDDGYKDNLDFAYPVFKKNSIPFTIYVTNSFPDRTAIIWWYILEDLILKNSSVKYSFSVGSVDLTCQTIKQKERAFSDLRSLITQINDINLEKELTGFFTKYGFSIAEHNNDLVLNWNEISQLSSDSLVSIGAHTLNHYNLCNLQDDQSFHEISECKKLLESKIKHIVNHFSYPFGAYGLRELNFVNKSNFLTATTVINANTFYNHIDHQFSLPRITINSLSNEKVLNLQINGFYPAILNKFKRVIY
jgi:peptidoglycan/xylan/chitin deacetylase (PgdA/CDA1 family)